MKQARRSLLLSAVLLVAVVVLSYRTWFIHQVQSRLSRARAYLEQDKPELALFHLRPLLKEGRQDGELFYLAAWSYRLVGEPEKCLNYATLAGELGHEASEVDRERGLALFGLGRFPEAEPLLRASPTRESVAALAMLHLEMFEMDQVLRDLDAWCSLDPKNPVPHIVRGDIWLQAADYEKAVESFRHALEIEPEDFEARLKLASALHEMGRLDEASALLRQCQNEQPNDPTAVMLLARCKSECGDPAAARALLQDLLEVLPHWPAALVELGKIELEEGNFVQATNLLHRAVKLEPHNDSALYNLATALKRLDRTDEAAHSLAHWSEIQRSRQRLRDLLDRVEADPTDIEAHAEAGAVCLDLGDTRQAARHLTAALVRDANHAAARTAVNRLRAQISDFDAAAGSTAIRETRP